MTRSRTGRRLRAAILMLCVGQGIAAPTTAQVITNPDWERKPSGEEFSGAYPPMAADLGIEARVVVACRVTAEGVLADCAVQSETPMEQGFGVAALSVTRYFRMRPKMSNGRGVGGGQVRIPLHFKLPSATPPRDQPGPATSERALVLARQLVAAERLPEQFAAFMAPGSPLFAHWVRPGLSASLREEGEASLRRAFNQNVGAFNEDAARAYASVLDEGQLQAALAFAATPSGQAAARRVADFQALNGPTSWVAGRIGFATARERFCKGRDCQEDPNFEAKLPARPPPTVLTADWLQQPDRWQIVSAGPWAIRAMSLRGAARLRCDVVATGSLESCSVLGETPRGLGFGPAALGLSGYYRMQPLPPGNGRASVELTIRFPEPSAVPPPFPPQPAWDSDPSEARKALGRQLIEATNLDPAYEVELAHNLAFLDGQSTPGLAPPTRADARAAMIAGMTESRRVILQDQALHYAGLFSESELRDLIAWRTSPAGRARQAHEAELAKLTAERNTWFYAEVMRAAGQIFCASHDCGNFPAPKKVSAAPPKP